MGKKKTWIMLSHRSLEAAEPVAYVSMRQVRVTD